MLKNRRHYRAIIALSLIPRLGIHRTGLLVKHFDDASTIFGASGGELEAIEGIGPATADQIKRFRRWSDADNILRRTDRCGARMLALNEPGYPALLKEIHDPPPLLWMQGHSDALTAPSIAIVGTRRPDKYGISQANEWASKLSLNGLTIVSGLAYGIDSVAHRSVVERSGRTVAVLGSGIDHIYPSTNRGLANDILDNGGAILTEFPPGTRPEAENFPRRNRVVSGMCRGVLVIQSGITGGSMITARIALEQNREVFLVPHSLDNPRGIGCNELIKRGEGKLVRTPEDLWVELQYEPVERAGPVENRISWRSAGLPEASHDVCEILEEGGLHIDGIRQQTGKTANELLTVLLDLEMRGVIRQKSGKYFELT